MRARTLTPIAPAVTALLLAGCSGAGDGGGSGAADAPPMRLVAYDGCDDVLSGLRDATAKQVGPYGIGAPGLYSGLTEDGPARAKTPAAAPGPDAASGEGSAAQAPAHSGTNAHEASADEPDLVKTDGRRIVALARGRLQVIDAASRKVVHTLTLPRPDGGPDGAPGGPAFVGGDDQLLLSGDRALVLTPEAPRLLDARPMPGGDVPATGPRPERPQTRLTLVDLSGAPKVAATMTTDASYVDARQTGSVARVVVRSTPRIDFPARSTPPKEGAGERRAVDRNREIVRKAPLDAWRPSFTVGGKTYRTPCDQISRPASYTGTTMLSVLTLDLARGLGDPSPVAVAADGQTVYGTGSSLYVTGVPPQAPTWDERRTDPRPAEQRTDVHRFDLRGAERPRYVASGSVPGALLNQYSLSEYGGNLRIATTTTPVVTPRGGPDTATSNDPAARSESAVRVLARRGARLERIGEIGGLGKGERIYSVRFLGPTAYVVTFRQVDPLYAVDLKDPAKPRVTGELKITGYSAYLHPASPGRLIGVGQEADGGGRTRGTQVSLFDVNAAPRKLDGYRLPASSAAAEFEPHAFLYWPRNGLTVVPVSRHNAARGEALVLKVEGDRVKRLGSIRHPGSDFGTSVQRSLLVGDTLWTFSDQGAQATDTTSLKERAWLDF